ncbi:hypothetical protein [Desulfitobacterium metallireducens]|uniref:Collagen-like protein n=1 Tax=Desulfitobacterium metallireducens DSM 15288 TaxID=871968 RepID=W0EHH4_9FIRM|nr:hypothetical protein [Desulfitobacterium metallireducens]AHF08526.1 hypothetical protein DESME_06915 [Desulfitobacterium metallireducens DSM 15288]
MENIFSWIPIIIAILVALSSASEKIKGKPGSKSLTPSLPWVKGLEPREFELPKWLTQAIPGIETLLTTNERIEEYPYEKTVINDRTMGLEGTIGIEGTAGDEGTLGIEGAIGVEGNSGVEGTSGTEGASGQEDTAEAKPLSTLKRSLQAGGKSITNIPNNEDLINAVVWAEILNKPKALRARR